MAEDSPIQISFEFNPNTHGKQALRGGESKGEGRFEELQESILDLSEVIRGLAPKINQSTKKSGENPEDSEKEETGPKRRRVKKDNDADQGTEDLIKKWSFLRKGEESASLYSPIEEMNSLMSSSAKTDEVDDKEEYGVGKTEGNDKGSKKYEFDFELEKRKAQVFWDIYYNHKETKGKKEREEENEKRERKNSSSFSEELLGGIKGLIKAPLNPMRAITSAVSKISSMLGAVAVKSAPLLGVGAAAAGVAEMITNAEAREKALSKIGAIKKEDGSYDTSKIKNVEDKKLADSLLDEKGMLKSASETDWSSFANILVLNIGEALPMITDKFNTYVWSPAVKFLGEALKPVLQELGDAFERGIRNKIADRLFWMDSDNEKQADAINEELKKDRKSADSFQNQFADVDFDYDDDEQTKKYRLVGETLFGFAAPGRLRDNSAYRGFLEYISESGRHGDLSDAIESLQKSGKSEEFFNSDRFTKWKESTRVERGSSVSEIDINKDLPELVKAMNEYINAKEPESTSVKPVSTVDSSELELRKQEIVALTTALKTNVSENKNQNNSDKSSSQSNNVINNSQTNVFGDPTGTASLSYELTSRSFA